MPLHPHLLAADSTPLTSLAVSFDAPSVEKLVESTKERKRVQSPKAKHRRRVKRSELNPGLSKQISKFSSLTDEKKVPVGRLSIYSPTQGVFSGYGLLVYVYMEKGRRASN